VTQLIARMPDDPAVRDQLMPLVYDELKRVASRCLADERGGHTLQTTALVNEAFIRLAGHQAPWRDRVHFFAAAATAMRRILVDHARARNAQRRGADPERVTLDRLHESAPGADVLDLDRALEELQALDPRKARCIELFYFAGLDYEDIAEALGTSGATTKRDLQFARAWLKTRLDDGR